MAADANQDFITYKGDDVAPVFTVRDSNGDPINISTVTEITWSARRNIAAAADVTKTKTGGGITFVTDGADGQFQVAITKIDTAALDGFYLHTASIADATGNITTVTVGRMQVGQAPAWTYDATQLASSSLYQVRRIIGDVLFGEQQLTDNEINFALSIYTNVYLASAECCRQLAAQFARLVDTVQGELKTNYSQKSRSYAAMAKDFEARGMARSGAGMPYAGGISVSDKNAVAANPDRVAPAFNVGMDDNLQYPGPYPNQTPPATPSEGNTD